MRRIDKDEKVGPRLFWKQVYEKGHLLLKIPQNGETNATFLSNIPEPDFNNTLKYVDACTIIECIHF